MSYYVHVQEPPVRASRPLGVWIFTILNVLGAGVSLFATAMVLLMAGFGGLSGALFLGLLVNVEYQLAIVFLTFGLWLGNNLCRVLFLWLVSMYCLLTAGFAVFNAYLGGTGEPIERTAGQVLGAFLGMLIYLWYFRRARTVAFYR
jgi:hypothetical protein